MTYSTQWAPGSYGTSKRHWHVWRHPDSRGAQSLLDSRDKVRWFGSFETAKRAADAANARMCKHCDGLGAFGATGLMCDDCLGGGETLP